MAKLIDGRAIAEKVYVDLRREIAQLKAKGITPGLAVILVGENPASRAYVRSKDKMCRDLGLHSLKLELPESTTQRELLRRVEELNRDSSIHGILVQSPPPEHIDEVAIVGKPLALLLMQKNKNGNATVTVVHSRSRDLAHITRSADIVIAAIGRAEFVKADHVREGAVVIDVGINRVEDAATERGYRLVGDVAFDEVSEKASAITPVPGGVGPMTIAMLMANTVKAARQSL